MSLKVKTIHVEGSGEIKSFEIATFLVTQKLWKEVTGETYNHDVLSEDCPVYKVSWVKAKDFINKLNSITGEKFRLPTEAEWTFAAKGGLYSKGYTYCGGNILSQIAWDGDNSGCETHPVGLKRSNELGIYDMSGNVWEWCEDYNHYEMIEHERIIKGGEFLLPVEAQGYRPDERWYCSAEDNHRHTGIRLVKSVPNYTQALDNHQKKIPVSKDNEEELTNGETTIGCLVIIIIVILVFIWAC